MNRKLACRCRFLGWAWSLVALLMLGCEEDQLPKCDAVCTHLESCGFLPSSLGTSKSSCQSRCQLTGDDVRIPVQQCLEERFEMSGPRPWCDGTCQGAASCLSDLTEVPTRLLGQAEADIQVATVSAPEPPAAPRSLEMCLRRENTGSRAGEPEASDAGSSSSDAEAQCRSLRATELEFVLQPENSDSNPESMVSIPCVRALEFGVRHKRLVPGIYLNYVRVRGADALDHSTEPSSDAGSVPEQDAEAPAPTPLLTPYCRLIFGAPLLLQASQTSTSVIEIPRSFTLDDPATTETWTSCEEGETACTDGRDNDGNTRADCAETACRPYCTEDGETNGADASVTP